MLVYSIPERGKGVSIKGVNRISDYDIILLRFVYVRPNLLCVKIAHRNEVKMKELLYKIVEMIAEVHRHILGLNDSYEYNFSDKQLHFLVIGALGMVFIFIIYPLFKWLAENDHVMIIAWIYVFTLILVITFAIEIGQKVTNTGNMEFNDIVMGIFGFIAMFFVFAIVREIYKAIRRAIVALKDRR